MKDKKYCIYCHTNKINGMKYIGQTCQSVSRRWRENGEGYKKQPYFYNAIQKYGWDNFEHEILFENLSLEEANQKETELIALYQTCEKNKGYNLNYGGDNCVPSESAREKMSKNNAKYWLGKHLSDEHKRKCSEAAKLHTGEKNSRYGKPLSDEHKRKLSESNRKSHQGLKVICVETGMVYNSISEASRQTGTDKSSISRCCKHIFNQANNLHWEYYVTEEAI